MSGAPPADRLETEARRFLDWINGESGEPPLIKAHFWRRFAGVPMNERQVKLLERLLDGFEGKLATSRWAAFAKCSPDTALRDINESVCAARPQWLAHGQASRHASPGSCIHAGMSRCPCSTRQTSTWSGCST